jgi:hypothetical protein
MEQQHLMRYFSNSEFQTFKRCRRKWWLGWFRRLKPLVEGRTGSGPLGTKVHRSLAPLYVPADHVHEGLLDPAGNQYVGPIDPRETVERLIREERAAVIEAWAHDPQQADGELSELDKQNDYVRAMVDGYMAWLEQTGADSDFEVLGSEVPVTLEVSPGRSLVARLDARVRRISDGIRFFIDHKTCANFPDLQRSLKASEQMPTYLIIERATAALEGERTHGAIFNGLRKVKRTVNAKPPFFDRFDKTYNEHELESQWVRIHGQIRDIEEVEVRIGRGEDPRYAAYPNKTRDCHWQCEFYPVCDMFDDGSRAEDMLGAIYQVGDSLDRYPELTGGRDMETEDE